MAFINTVDRLGDDVTFKSIVERTIAEFKDDKVKRLGVGSFRQCTDLTCVAVPSVKHAFQDSICNCSSVTLVDFTSLETIDDGAIYNCQLLTSLVLRNSTLTTLSNAASNFVNTPIASGTGYIYVPKALVEDYKVATNWVTYASQFRALEDYTVDGTIHGELDESKI